MRLDEDLIRALKQIAIRKGISYQSLARMWLRESAIEELRWVSKKKPSKARGYGNIVKEPEPEATAKLY